MKLFVHIGYYKTGTTALQKFLEINRVILRKQGVCYPTAGKPVNNWGMAILANGLLESVGAQVPAWYQRGKLRRPDIYDFHTQWAKVVRELEECGCRVGIISCEAFIRFGNVPQAQELVEFVKRQLAGFDVRIVCYIRRPDRYLVSWYSQLVSSGDRIPRLRLSMEHYLRTIHVDYMKAMRPWAGAFGADSILVREYDAIRHSNSNTIQDFVNLCEINLAQGIRFDRQPVHKSLPYALVELKRLHNHCATSMSDLRKANRALKYVQDKFQLPQNTKVEMLSLENKRQLIDAFLPSQQELTRLWGNGRIFFQDLAEPMLPDPLLITDAEAALQYERIFETALSRVSQLDRESRQTPIVKLPKTG